MPSSVPACLTCGLLALVPVMTAAQPRVALGAWVRAIGADLPQGRVYGTLTRLGPDTIELDSHPFPRTAITQLQVLDGSRSHVGEGLLVGGLAGAGVGWLISRVCFPSSEQCEGPGTGRGEYPVIGALLGGAIGALAGSLVLSEHWRDVPLGAVHIGLERSDTGKALVLVVALQLQPQRWHY